MIKSQRISQFLEDVNRQMPVATMNNMKTSVPNTHRPQLVQNSRQISDSNKSSPKTMSKYPTYERTPSRSMDTEHQIMVIRENKVPSPVTAMGPAGDTGFMKPATAAAVASYRKSATNYRSPKSSSSVLTIAASSTPRLSEKTKTIMAKYSSGESGRGEGQSTYHAALKRAIVGAQNPNASITANMVTIEEFNQRRSSSEATQALIKEVKAKSEKLASRVQLNSSADSMKQESSVPRVSSTSMDKEPQTLTEPQTLDSNLSASLSHLEITEDSQSHVKQNQVKEVLREMKEKKARSSRKEKESVGGNGDARSARVNEVPTKDSESSEPVPINTQSPEQIENWSKLFSETWSKIPQSKESDEKDKVELESLMDRLNSMSSELNSINQQLKKDVLQIPKAIKVDKS